MKISTHKPKKDGPSRQHTEEDTEIGLILHISVSDEKLFPEAQLKEFCKTYDNSEKGVYINNDWQIKDTTRTTNFDDIIATNLDIDWLTFITENNLF